MICINDVELLNDSDKLINLVSFVFIWDKVLESHLMRKTYGKRPVTKKYAYIRIRLQERFRDVNTSSSSNTSNKPNSNCPSTHAQTL